MSIRFLCLLAQVRSFLELSSAEQLFNKLQEKEHFLNLSMLEKDKALEAQRKRVAALSADYGRAQNALHELQAQLFEAARERETAKAAVDAALDLARQQVTSLEKALALAQAETADATQAREVAEQQLAIQQQVATSCASEVSAQRRVAGAAAERAAEAEAGATSLRESLAAAEAQLREAEIQLKAMRREHADAAERALAAEVECAAAKAAASRDAAEVCSAKAEAVAAANDLRTAQEDAERLRLRLEEFEAQHHLEMEDVRSRATVAQQELRAQAAAAAAADAERSELQAAQDEAMRAAREASSARLAAVEAQRDEMRARLAAVEALRGEEGGVAATERAPELHEAASRHEVSAALREAEALRLELASAVAEAEAIRTDLSRRNAELARANERAHELSAAVEGLTSAAAEAPQPSTPCRPSPVSLTALALTPTLPSATEVLGSLQVKVTACVKKEEGSVWWWVFQVRVTTAGLSFLLVRRYSQFVRMHDRLRALPLPPGRMPLLPRKQRYTTQSERFAEKRRAALDVYLGEVVADRELRQTLALQAFLELGALLGRTVSLHTPGTDAFASPGSTGGGFASPGFSEPHTR